MDVRAKRFLLYRYCRRKSIHVMVNSLKKIGTYNPNTNPATVDLNFDRALDWVMKGAQPTDTVRNISLAKVFT